MLIEYRGKNGLNYVTKEDADLYGGGCVGKINNTPRDIEPVVEEIEEDTMPVGPVSVPTALVVNAIGQGQTLSLNDLSIDQLREYAKEKKIKGYAIMGRKKLIEKLSA